MSLLVDKVARELETMKRERQLSDLLVFISRITKEQIQENSIPKIIGDFFIEWDKKNNEEMIKFFNEKEPDLFTNKGEIENEVHE